MTAACLPVVLFFCFMLSAAFVVGREVDRLIIAVNGRAITEGDLELARVLNELISYDKSTQLKSRESEIDRLVDLELMRQELKSFSIALEDEGRVEARLQSLRDIYAGKGGLALRLQELGLQESELIAQLQFESSMMGFVGFRFRPFVKVSDEEIRAYYEGRLAAQLQKAKLALPALSQVSGRIEEILREEKVNTVLEQWIRELRRSARIEYFAAAGDFDSSPTGSADK